MTNPTLTRRAVEQPIGSLEALIDTAQGSSRLHTAKRYAALPTGED
jgi:hypothetical protein